MCRAIESAVATNDRSAGASRPDGSQNGNEGEAAKRNDELGGNGSTIDPV